MYSTCLFCNVSLGANEALEQCAVGRRIAYDATAGRLWVVCKSCERWNLSPFESRWEAIDEAERAFRSTRIRVSGENISMAQLRDGTELVRIGKPPKLELAVWRYGDQFGRRRRKAFVAAAIPVSVCAALAGLSAASLYGRSFAANWLVSLGGASAMLNSLFSLAYARYENRRGNNLRVQVNDESNRQILLTRFVLPSVLLIAHGKVGEWKLRIPDWEVPPANRSARPHVIGKRVSPSDNYIEVRGEKAARALGAILPHINADSGSRRNVGSAVQIIEQSKDVHALLQTAAVTRPQYRADYHMDDGRSVVASLPVALRLAMEMALHADDERRAMQGELAELEQRWRDADTIARIADGLLVSATVGERMVHLRERNRG